MANCLNKAHIIGFVGVDPVCRKLNNGEPVVNLSIGTSEQFRSRKSGQREERTEWHKVVIFNPNLCEIAEKFVKKGNKIYIEGELHTRKWTDNNKIDRYITEIIVNRFTGTMIMLDKNAAVAHVQNQVVDDTPTSDDYNDVI